MVMSLVAYATKALAGHDNTDAWLPVIADRGEPASFDAERPDNLHREAVSASWLARKWRY